MALAAWSLRLVARLVEAWRLELLAIDHDPGTMLSPSITHDFKVLGMRRQLSRRRVTYFYCEFFLSSSSSGVSNA